MAENPDNPLSASMDCRVALAEHGRSTTLA